VGFDAGCDTAERRGAEFKKNVRADATGMNAARSGLR
jgi:hypothetical protein